MFAPKSDGATDGVRRFLADLRTSVERRSGRERRLKQRRVHTARVARDRRTADRRTGSERRLAAADRRQPTSDAFSRGDAEHIREMLMDPGVEAACPQCDGNLLLGSVMPHHGGTARHVHCTRCRRGVFIVSAPGKPLELG